MHIHTTSLKLACTALLCLLQNIYVAADYQFEVVIHSYSNPRGWDANRDCCDSGPFCTSGCDPYFDTFCLRSSRHSHSDLTTCSLGSSGRRIESLPATVTIAATGPWPGGFQLYIRVQDEDTFTPDDLIDRIFAESNIRPSSTFSNTMSVRGDFGIATLGLRFRVTCSQDYYRADCDTFCRPRNDNRGHYDCDENGNRRCLPGYTEPSTNCITPVDCGNLRRPSNGQVSLPETTFGSTATYTCNPGYDLVGRATRTCQADGTWSRTAPTCEVVDCGSLASPTNGQVTFSGGTTFGSTATYTCNPGYDLVGSTTRTCQAGGTWSRTAPTCEADCGSLPNPSNGRVTFSRGTTSGPVATYTCNLGYNLVGSATRTCQTTATWSGSAPVCTVVDCGSLASPTNGQVTFSGGTTFGSTATYTCNTGYNLVGSTTRTCQTVGTWSGSAPTCEADCGSLPNPSNGRVTFSRGTTSGSTVATYTCNSGYSLVGSATRTCQTTGTWSGFAPVCTDVASVCSLSPCENGGSCLLVERDSNYICMCASGFTGENCTTNINDCEGANCPENRTCVDGVNSFECVCNPGLQCEESEAEAAVGIGLAVGVSVFAGTVLIFCGILCVICIFVVTKYRRPKRTPATRGPSSSVTAQVNQQHPMTLLPSSEHQAQPVATPGLPTIPPNATDELHANYGMFNEPPPPSYTAAVGYPQPQYSNPLFTGYPQEAAYFPPPSAPPRFSAI